MTALLANLIGEVDHRRRAEVKTIVSVHLWLKELFGKQWNRARLLENRFCLVRAAAAATHGQPPQAWSN